MLSILSYGKPITGNHAEIKIDGQIVGLAQNVTVRDEMQWQKLHGIGDVSHKEFVPSMLTHVITGDSYLLASKNLRQLGLMVNDKDWPEIDGFTVQIVDKKRGTNIDVYTECKFESHVRTIGKHSIAGTNFTIIALKRAN